MKKIGVDVYITVSTHTGNLGKSSFSCLEIMELGLGPGKLSSPGK